MEISNHTAETGYSYNSRYTMIFALFYLIQGFHQSILYAIMPTYLTELLGGYDLSRLMLIYSIGTVPWAIKFIVGFLNDRFYSPKYGRRVPFILIFGIWAGFWWATMGVHQPYFPADDRVYNWLLFYDIMTNIGFAIADTALDGLILDITPKEKLAKVQGYTWTMLLLGNAIGGGLFGYIFLRFHALHWLFILNGCFMIIAALLPKSIKEFPTIPTTDVKVELKKIFTEPINWKVFIFTLLEPISAPIIVTIFGYFLLVKMNIMTLEQTLVSLQQGEAIDLFGYQLIFTGINGVGIAIGSLIAGYMGDRNRKQAVTLAFVIFIPMCFLSNFVSGLILGIITLLIFGIAQGELSISGQTIRGDITKNNFPDLKGTYFALLVSISNGGQSLGFLIGSNVFRGLAQYSLELNQLYFFITLVTAGLLILSYITFLTIPAQNYEFIKNIKTV